MTKKSTTWFLRRLGENITAYCYDTGKMLDVFKIKSFAHAHRLFAYQTEYGLRYI